MAWSLCGLALLYTIGAAVLGGHEASALCKCAERFPSSSDLNDNSFGFFDSLDALGETWVFSSMRFHCQGHVTTITYKADYSNSCRCNCDCSDTDGDLIDEDLLPQIQLWRKNDTTYSINRTVTLTKVSGRMVVDWAFQEDDVMGLWIPSAANMSSCVTEQVLKVQYLYHSSRAYRISGYVDFFDTMDTELRNGPMPMITVETDSYVFEPGCLVGCSVGVGIVVMSLCIVCAVIMYSTYRTFKSGRGHLTINPENYEEGETELHNLQTEIPSVPNFEDDAVYEDISEHNRGVRQPGVVIANQHIRPQSAASQTSSHSHYTPPSSPDSNSPPSQHEYRPIPAPRQMSRSTTETRLSPTPSPSYQLNSTPSPPPPLPPDHPSSPSSASDFDFNTTIQQLEEEANSFANLAAMARNDKDNYDTVEPAMFANNFNLRISDSIITQTRRYENVVMDHRENTSDNGSSATEYEDNGDSDEDDEDVYVT